MANRTRIPVLVHKRRCKQVNRKKETTVEAIYIFCKHCPAKRNYIYVESKQDHCCLSVPRYMLRSSKLLDADAQNSTISWSFLGASRTF